MPDITVGVNRDMRGGLDSDTDVNYLNGGNYPDCVNVERNNDSTGGSDTPSLGNTLEYILPEIQKQSQKVRIFNSLSDLQNQQYNFIRMSLYNNNGFLIKNSYLVDTSYDIKSFNGIKNAVQAVLGSTIWVGLANGSVTGLSNTLNNIFAQEYFDVLFDFEYDSYVFQLVPGFGDLTLITSGGGSIGGGIVAGGNDGKRVINDIPGRIGGGEFAVNNNSSVGTRIVDSFTEFDPLKTRIIEEAYSASAAGKPHLIGSKENNSKLFMCWTTKTQEQSKIKTVGGVDMYVNTSTLGAGSGKLWIQTNITPHGLIDYQSIILANASEPFSIYNGTWVIRVVDETTFYLAASNAASVPTVPTKATAEIYTNVDGVGLFVVQSYFVQTNKYGIKIPLRSKKLNWITKNQIDLDIEFFNKVYSLYYNDFLNRPRVTYFNELIETDGAIESINPNGQYEYEVLGEQIILQQNNSSNIQITILDQLQGGGSLYSGSYRYGVVLVTDSETETEISELSDIIRVYPPLYEEGAMVYGDYGNSSIYASTSKINRIQVDGIPAGVFKYIDLICVIIDGSDNTTLTSTQTLTISRTLLGPDETTVSLEHSGNEVDIRNFTLAKLNPVKETILKAYNNVIGENRLLISNFVTTQSVNISEWVDTFKYSIKRQGVYSDWIGENWRGFASPSQDYGDVEAPVGYQLYEWYRFYIVAEYIEGGFTDACFCFDVRFVTQQDYIDSANTPDDFRFLSTNGYDRRDLNGDELTSYHLSETQDSGRFRYQWGIELKNINWDFSFDGVKARDLFKKLSVYRAERIDEVLASGYTVMSVKKRTFGLVQSSDPDVPATPTYTIVPNQLFDYPFSIKQNSTYGQVTAESYDQLYSLQTDLRQMKYGSFYSMDYLYQPQLFAFRPLDQIVFLGCSRPAFTDRYYSGGPSGNNEDNYLRVFKNPIVGSFQNAITRNLVDFKFIGINSDQAIGTEGITYIKKMPPNNQEELYTYLRVYLNGLEEFPLPLTSVSRLQERSLYGLNTGSPVFQLDEEINVSELGTDFKRFYDYGVYLSIHFRKRSNKYGVRASNNNIQSTNYIINSGESSKIVFGGDVYTQGSYMKKQYFSSYDGSDSQNAKGGSASWLMLSQNRINTQLRTINFNLPNLIYPQQIPDWQTWSLKTIIQQEYYNYNSGYLEVKNQQLVPAFDPELLTRTTFPTRIIYSELKPNSSVKDFYRLFPPGQFRDNPNNFGAIIHMDLKQGELFTLQELCYTREFLNSTGQLATVDSGQVVIGDSSVLSRPGIRLTQLGSKHKWSYARGLTDAGTDVRCWVNSDFFVVLRAGRDGTVNLTERSFMDTYLRDHMRFVKDKFTPADGQGIHAIWDDVGKNFIITCRGWRDNSEWSTLSNSVSISEGTVVRYKEQYGVPILYLCLSTLSGNDLLIPPDSPLANRFWQKIEFSDINYYSVFTIAFNEARNRFTHFQTFYPKIYANHFDRYFSPNPYEGESNKFYLMRQGEPLVFYDEEHEGYTEYVINQEPSILKKFVALGYNSIYKPYKVEMRTQFISEEGIDDRYTYLNRDEFRMRENIAFSTIKNSVNEEGETDKRSAPMKGLWLKLKTFFKAREYQKINDIFVPIRTGQRNVKNP
jgi:hypothetical protein